MHWKDIESDGCTAWTGLELFVDEPGRPALQVQAGTPRIIRLLAGVQPLLWARVEPTYFGYWFLRSRLQQTVLEPLCADDVRSVNEQWKSAAWYRGWARKLATRIAGSELSPLHSGRWWLVPAAMTTPASPIEQRPCGFVEWDVGTRLLPSRSGPSRARRKRA